MRISKTLTRRAAVVALAASFVAAPAIGGALAAEYPSGPVQILVAYGAGGGTDTLARLIAPALSEALGKPVTVQNLPGGGGQVAAATALRDGGDGLAILATNQPDLSLSTILAKPPYKNEDFEVIVADILDPRILLVKKESDMQNFDDFVSRAKAQPGKLAVSITQGGAQELFAKWLFGKLGLDVRLVGYNGGAAAANAMIAGDVVATVGDDSARMNIRDKSKALLLGAGTPSPRWPEAATMPDALKKYDVTPPSPTFLARYGVYVVPASFKQKDPEGYKKLQQALIEARKSKEFEAFVEKNKLQDLSIGKPGEDLASYFSADTAEIQKMK